MASFIIEIHPMKPEFDPAANQLRTELLERGVPPKEAIVETERLYRIDGEFSLDQIETIAATLLVDPVIEKAFVIGFNQKGKMQAAPKKKGAVLDVWLKPGVTDPVGETVIKGLKDLGYNGEITAFSAARYVFPKYKNEELLQKLARQTLANELIHDIRLSIN